LPLTSIRSITEALASPETWAIVLISSAVRWMMRQPSVARSCAPPAR